MFGLVLLIPVIMYTALMYLVIARVVFQVSSLRRMVLILVFCSG